ncbi:hypothetical protein LJR186_001479 [Microbacterium foliorum]
MTDSGALGPSRREPKWARVAEESSARQREHDAKQKRAVGRCLVIGLLIVAVWMTIVAMPIFTR